MLGKKVYQVKPPRTGVVIPRADSAEMNSPLKDVLIVLWHNQTESAVKRTDIRLQNETA